MRLICSGELPAYPSCFRDSIRWHRLYVYVGRGYPHVYPTVDHQPDHCDIRQCQLHSVSGDITSAIHAAGIDTTAFTPGTLTFSTRITASTLRSSFRHARPSHPAVPSPTRPSTSAAHAPALPLPLTPVPSPSRPSTSAAPISPIHLSPELPPSPRVASPARESSTEDSFIRGMFIPESGDLPPPPTGPSYSVGEDRFTRLEETIASLHSLVQTSITSQAAFFGETRDHLSHLETSVARVDARLDRIDEQLASSSTTTYPASSTQTVFPSSLQDRLATIERAAVRMDEHLEHIDQQLTSIPTTTSILVPQAEQIATITTLQQTSADALHAHISDVSAIADYGTTVGRYISDQIYAAHPHMPSIGRLPPHPHSPPQADPPTDDLSATLPPAAGAP